jgi:hypothetical protein
MSEPVQIGHTRTVGRTRVGHGYLASLTWWPDRSHPQVWRRPADALQQGKRYRSQH